MKYIIKDVLAVLLFILISASSVYIFLVALDDHIAIENEKELQYQHYIYKESLR